MTGAEMSTLIKCLVDRRKHFSIPMSKQQGSMAAKIINILVAIDIPHPAALAAGHEERRASNGAEGAHGAVHAAGETAASAGVSHSAVSIMGLSCTIRYAR